jgi:hypothetical protein
MGRAVVRVAVLGKDAGGVPIGELRPLGNAQLRMLRCASNAIRCRADSYFDL